MENGTAVPGKIAVHCLLAPAEMPFCACFGNTSFCASAPSRATTRNPEISTNKGEGYAIVLSFFLVFLFFIFFFPFVYKLVV